MLTSLRTFTPSASAGYCIIRLPSGSMIQMGAASGRGLLLLAGEQEAGELAGVGAQHDRALVGLQHLVRHRRVVGDEPDPGQPVHVLALAGVGCARCRACGRSFPGRPRHRRPPAAIYPSGSAGRRAGRPAWSASIHRRRAWDAAASPACRSCWRRPATIAGCSRRRRPPRWAPTCTGTPAPAAAWSACGRRDGGSGSFAGHYVSCYAVARCAGNVAAGLRCCGNSRRRCCGLAVSARRLSPGPACSRWR